MDASGNLSHTGPDRRPVKEGSDHRLVKRNRTRDSRPCAHVPHAFGPSRYKREGHKQDRQPDEKNRPKGGREGA